MVEERFLLATLCSVMSVSLGCKRARYTWRRILPSLIGYSELRLVKYLNLFRQYWPAQNHKYSARLVSEKRRRFSQFLRTFTRRSLLLGKACPRPPLPPLTLLLALLFYSSISNRFCATANLVYQTGLPVYSLQRHNEALLANSNSFPSISTTAIMSWLGPSAPL